MFNRWQNPEDPEPWKGAVYDATKYKPGCSQHGCETMNPPLVCPDKVGTIMLKSLKKIFTNKLLVTIVQNISGQLTHDW